MTFAVKAETLEGKVLTLRNGLASRDDAEAHPVRLSLWKRVWVEGVETKPEPRATPTLPPLPWDWVATDKPDVHGRFHAYLVDATGRKIAAIWGAGAEKALIADHILKLVNASTEEV